MRIKIEERAQKRKQKGKKETHKNISTNLKEKKKGGEGEIQLWYTVNITTILTE